MSLEKISGAIKNACTSELVIWPVMIGSACLGGSLGTDWAEENWDNAPTEKTEQVMKGVAQDISDLDLLDTQLKLTNLEADRMSQSMGAEWKDSSEWETYTVGKIRSEDKLKEQYNDLFATVMNSPDITEEGLASITKSFNSIGFDNLDENKAEFPKNKYAYAFKECQTEIGIGDSVKTADAITACTTDKADLDDLSLFWALPGAIFGVFALIGVGIGAGRVEETARKKGPKKQLKRQHN